MEYCFGDVFKRLLCPLSLLLLQFVTWAATAGTTYESEWLSRMFPSTRLTPSSLSSTASRDLVPRYVLELYEEMKFQDEKAKEDGATGNENDAIMSFKVQLERVIVDPGNVIKRGLNFNLTYLANDSNILSAELVFPVRTAARRSQIMNTHVEFEGVPLQRMPRSTRNRDYLVFDATQALLANRLNANPWVEVSAPHMRPNSTLTAHFRHNSLGEVLDGLYLDKALMIVYENIDAARLRSSNYRSKRQTSRGFVDQFWNFNAVLNFTTTRTHTPDNGTADDDDDDDDDQAVCGVRPWYVDFASMGWVWIVSPRGYYANSCGGTCTLGTVGNRMTNYAFMKSLYHRHTGFQHADTLSVTSCTPTRMSPVRLLYYNINHDLISQRLPQMAVSECGCR
ncbi:protein dbl-1-like [Gigantopelta aegis]|uniref:protein dbl-1-like n=1 Tax=Gigantopelta aegis TaxID=1735272 RepID=UPI001B889D28|nr:protein dbl-1-like [Gigantopelta aegis]